MNKDNKRFTKKKIPVGTRFFAPVQTGPGAHTASCTMGAGSFPGVEAAEAWGLTPPPLSNAEVLEKRRAIPLLTLRLCVSYKKDKTYLNMPHAAIMSAHPLMCP